MWYNLALSDQAKRQIIQQNKPIALSIQLSYL